MRTLIVSLVAAPLMTFGATPATQPARDTSPVWKAPACTGATPPGTRRITGDKMQFAVPTNLRVKSGFDVDYGMNIVCAGKHCLSHGFGAMWSSGSPPDRDYFANVAEMKEREVFDLWSATMLGVEYNGREYRGRRADGTYFRFLGVFNETVRYDRATKAAAETLDGVIDSLCWRTEG